MLVLPSPPKGTGSHTEIDNCTGTLTFTTGPGFNLAIDPKGDEIWMILTNPNNVLLGTIKRVSRG